MIIFHLDIFLVTGNYVRNILGLIVNKISEIGWFQKNQVTEPPTFKPEYWLADSKYKEYGGRQAGGIDRSAANTNESYTMLTWYGEYLLRFFII